MGIYSKAANGIAALLLHCSELKLFSLSRSILETASVNIKIVNSLKSNSLDMFEISCGNAGREAAGGIATVSF